MGGGAKRNSEEGAGHPVYVRSLPDFRWNPQSFSRLLLPHPFSLLFFLFIHLVLTSLNQTFHDTNDLILFIMSSALDQLKATGTVRHPTIAPPCHNDRDQEQRTSIIFELGMK